MEKLKKSVRNITEIVVHCTATPAGRDVTVADVDRWHRQRGFAGIGYHYLIALDGTVYAGRDVDVAGAHCRGHNRSSIGVCYVGGLDVARQPADTRTQAQHRALRGLLVALKRLYPDAVIRGHRDFAAKACPCFDVTTEYAGL
ncbi:MAG: N-acetylmuramoyl-L-alanine amidase [Muribaculaceae bacterium]